MYKNLNEFVEATNNYLLHVHLVAPPVPMTLCPGGILPYSPLKNAYFIYTYKYICPSLSLAGLKGPLYGYMDKDENQMFI